jgi:hypothetical protein
VSGLRKAVEPFPGSPIAAVNSTARETHRRGGGADGRPAGHVLRLRTRTAGSRRARTVELLRGRLVTQARSGRAGGRGSARLRCRQDRRLAESPPRAEHRGWPVYHRKRDAVEADLTIVFPALAVSRWIEHQAGWSIRKFVRTARRYRTIQIQAGPHTITAADPVSGELRQALDAINGTR